MPVRGSSAAAGAVADADGAGAGVPDELAGAVTAGAVVGVPLRVGFFGFFFGAEGATSGSSYCWSPAPSASAHAGSASSISAVRSAERRRRPTRHLVADAPGRPLRVCRFGYGLRYAPRPARGTGPRLSARSTRRRTRLPRHVRAVSRRADLHPRLQRTGDRGPLRGPRRSHLVPPEDTPERAHIPRAFAVLPVGDRVVRPVGLRPDRVQLERLVARGGPRRDRGSRLVLPQPV